MFKKITSLCLIAVMIFSTVGVFAYEPVDDAEWNALKSHVNNMLLYDRYIENSKYPNIFGMGINTATKEPIVWKMNKNDYIPSNFLGQQNFYRVLVGMTELTGDETYKNIAKEQVGYWLNNFVDENGLLYTGAHSFVDVKTGYIYDEAHELKQSYPYLDLMFEVNPAKAIKYVEAVWNAHVFDWSNLSMDRHGRFHIKMSDLWDSSSYTKPSVDFINGNSTVKDPYAFLYTGVDLIDMAFNLADKIRATDSAKADKIVTWAKRMIQQYMDIKNGSTGLSGSVYGEGNYNGKGDRVYLQFGGDYGDIAYERNWIDADGLHALLGDFSSVLLRYVENHPEDTDYNAEILAYVVDNFKAFKKHILDVKDSTGQLPLPMFSDGTSLVGYEVKVSGYHGNAGDTITNSGQSIHPSILRSAIYAYKLSQDDEIWAIAHRLASNGSEAIGDIGTAPGTNVNLNDNIGIQTQYVFALLDLYDMTGNTAYLSGAEYIGGRIRSGRYSNGVLVASDRAMVNIDTEFALALLNIEAAQQGMYNKGTISNVYGQNPLDLIYDGKGRVQDITDVVFAKKPKTATAIDVPATAVEVPQRYYPTATNENIRKIQSLGKFTTKGDGSSVNINEFYDCISDLLGMTAAEFKAGIIAKANDPDYTSFVNGVSDLTVQNAAAIAAGAVMLKGNEEVQLPKSGTPALDKFTDSSHIADNIKKYVNIASSLYIVGDKDDNSLNGGALNPSQSLDAASASEIILKTIKFCDNELLNINASVADDVTDTRITYTSSDDSKVIVDEDGYLFPIMSGSATITATAVAASSVKATRDANLTAVSNNQLRDIWIDGNRLEYFSPFKYEYALNDEDGKSIKVTARTYSGNALSKDLASIPAAARLTVGGNSPVYIVAFNAVGDFKITEDFEDYDVNTSIATGIAKNGITWRTTSDNKPTVVADPKNSANLVLKANYVNKQFEAYANFKDTPILVGADAEDDKNVILEYKILVSQDVLPAGKKFETVLGVDYTPRAVKLDYTESSKDGFVLNDRSNTSDTKIASMPINSWVPVKIVLNKKTLTHDVYFNGELIKEGLNAPDGNSITPTKISSFYITLQANLGFSQDDYLYIDDIKIYEAYSATEPVLDNGVYILNADGDSIVSMKGNETATAKVILSDEMLNDDNLVILIAPFTKERVIKGVPRVIYPDKKEVTFNISASDFAGNVQNGDNVCIYVWNEKLKPILLNKYVYILE